MPSTSLGHLHVPALSHLSESSFARRTSADALVLSLPVTACVAFSLYLATAVVVQGTMNPDVYDSSDDDSDDSDDFSPQQFTRDSIRDLVALLMTAATYYLV